MKLRNIFLFGCMLLFAACSTGQGTPKKSVPYMGERFELTEDEWRDTLTLDQYYILRQKGTERAFTGEYWDNHAHGQYNCAGCGAHLFDSGTKFDSGTGWPSFYQPADSTCVGEISDHSHGMIRTEVICNRCSGHLGHVFRDGPAPTYLRYCINSASLNFEEK